MNIRVHDIFQEKLNAVQSRIPMKIAHTDNTASFQELLNSEMGNKSSLSKSGDKVSAETMNSIESAINDAGKKYNISSNIIKAVISAESSFNPQALSDKGAQGLMQLMPGTASALGVKNPWDITQNINGGVRYLKEQLDSFDGNLELALAAYNAGPNSVTKHGGIPPYAETQNYVKKILGYIDETR